VRITGTGLVHRPWETWRKKFILLLSMGSPDAAEARPIIELFTFMTGVLGPDNTLVTVAGTRLAAAGQIRMDDIALRNLYVKLKLPADLAAGDSRRNAELLTRCYGLGRSLTAGAERC